MQAPARHRSSAHAIGTARIAPFPFLLRSGRATLLNSKAEWLTLARSASSVARPASGHGGPPHTSRPSVGPGPGPGSTLSAARAVRLGPHAPSLHARAWRRAAMGPLWESQGPSRRRYWHRARCSAAQPRRLLVARPLNGSPCGEALTECPRAGALQVSSARLGGQFPTAVGTSRVGQPCPESAARRNMTSESEPPRFNAKQEL